jgi:hypothetical protein
MAIKSQDILVALNLCRKNEGLGSYAEKARKLGMSASEVHSAERRLSEARLFDADRKVIRKNAMLEFLVHGVPYVFAVSPGEWTRGVPTAWAAPVLVNKVSQGNQPPPVWPDPEGLLQGVTIKPLYSSVPKAVKDDPELYDLMALVDALRIGRVREKKLAEEELKSRLKPHG